MSEDTAEYAIVPGESILPGTQHINVKLPDGRPLSWDRQGEFDVHTVELTHEHACQMKDAGYRLSPDPREIVSPKPRKKTKTTKDPEE